MTCPGANDGAIVCPGPKPGPGMPCPRAKGAAPGAAEDDRGGKFMEGGLMPFGGGDNTRLSIGGGPLPADILRTGGLILELRFGPRESWWS